VVVDARVLDALQSGASEVHKNYKDFFKINFFVTEINEL
jgi:hypothetical protein